MNKDHWLWWEGELKRGTKVYDLGPVPERIKNNPKSFYNSPEGIKYRKWSAEICEQQLLQK